MQKHNALFNIVKSNSITIALDGTGGDNRSTSSIVSAVRFALAFMNPSDPFNCIWYSWASAGFSPLRHQS